MMVSSAGTQQCNVFDPRSKYALTIAKCETMAVIRTDSLFFNPLQHIIRDNIREKQASVDYESALQEYERVLQLRCLMELGR
jgi:hypothetical protein